MKIKYTHIVDKFQVPLFLLIELSYSDSIKLSCNNNLIHKIYQNIPEEFNIIPVVFRYFTIDMNKVPPIPGYHYSGDSTYSEQLNRKEISLPANINWTFLDISEDH